jgi:hypothetical protein
MMLNNTIAIQAQLTVAEKQLEIYNAVQAKQLIEIAKNEARLVEISIEMAKKITMESIDENSITLNNTIDFEEFLQKQFKDMILNVAEKPTYDKMKTSAFNTWIETPTEDTGRSAKKQRY